MTYYVRLNEQMKPGDTRPWYLCDFEEIRVDLTRPLGAFTHQKWRAWHSESVDDVRGALQYLGEYFSPELLNVVYIVAED